jgi:hypothetical protein
MNVVRTAVQHLGRFFKRRRSQNMDSSLARQIGGDLEEIHINSFKKNESALFKLSNKSFEKSLLCAEALKPDLEKKFGKDSKEFHSKYIPVLLEFMYFFLHLTNRSAFAQLGHEKRNKLYDELAPLVIDDTTRTLCTLFGWPTNLNDGINSDLRAWQFPRIRLRPSNFHLAFLANRRVRKPIFAAVSKPKGFYFRSRGGESGPLQ